LLVNFSFSALMSIHTRGAQAGANDTGLPPEDKANLFTIPANRSHSPKSEKAVGLTQPPGN